jgi:predicted Fe-S protein YdhL (DUF1289 family)
MTAESNRGAEAAAGGEGAGRVGSPCNSVCRMDAEGVYCVGCFRTLEEISGWSGFDDERRRLIWKELAHRKARTALTDQSGQAACERGR